MVDVSAQRERGCRGSSFSRSVYLGMTTYPMCHVLHSTYQSTICMPVPHITHHTSPTTHHLPHILYHTSPTTHLVPHSTYHTSPTAHRLPHREKPDDARAAALPSLPRHAHLVPLILYHSFCTTHLVSHICVTPLVCMMQVWTVHLHGWGAALGHSWQRPRAAPAPPAPAGLVPLARHDWPRVWAGRIA